MPRDEHVSLRGRPSEPSVRARWHGTGPLGYGAHASFQVWRCGGSSDDSRLLWRFLWRGSEDLWYSFLTVPNAKQSRLQGKLPICHHYRALYMQMMWRDLTTLELFLATLGFQFQKKSFSFVQIHCLLSDGSFPNLVGSMARVCSDQRPATVSHLLFESSSPMWKLHVASRVKPLMMIC